MDKKKLVKQLAVIAFVIVFFAVLDLGIYHFFIKRVISHHSPGMQKMSVEVSNYVPFTDSKNIFSVKDAPKLEGDIPTIDGAAALLPMYAGFVESIYPSGSVKITADGYAPESAMHYTNTRGAYKDIVDGKAEISISEIRHYSAKRYIEFFIVGVKPGKYQIPCKIMCTEYTEPDYKELSVEVE